jgi:hypothetical protein
MKSPRAWTLILTLVSGACAQKADDTAVAVDPLCAWDVHADSPLIAPPGAETLVGDPSVLRPNEAADGRWHLFANSMLGIHHYVSTDGLDWDLEEQSVITVGAWRPYLRVEGDTTYLYYEWFFDLSHSEIRLTTSTDLSTWTEPITVLQPTLDWEQETNATVGNPFVQKRDGQYWLYYSATGSLLEDVDFYEPRYIGVATTDSPSGPWTKEPAPLLAPDASDPWRNLGAGSIKLLDDPIDGVWIALNNGIYTHDGVSGSAIRVLESSDGLSWTTRCEAPILAPTGSGWMTAFVYAFDPVQTATGLRLYFNARDDWEGGIERIGMASTSLD